jgi:ribosomal-protein-alanine N-acetyltransferase
MTELDQLMAVMEASFDPHFREAWTRRQVEDSLALPSTYTILTDRNGEPPDPLHPAAGFVLARHAADEVELLLIAVMPCHRGKGLGKLLLEQFFESARQRYATQVFLEMRANNPARSLYESSGFEQIGQRKDYYRTVTGDTIDAMTFAKPV